MHDYIVQYLLNIEYIFTKAQVHVEFTTPLHLQR